MIGYCQVIKAIISVGTYVNQVAIALAEVTLMEFQLWQMSLVSADNSQRVAVGAIKSLFSFAHQLGVIPANLGILVKSPQAKNRLAERILTEDEVKGMIRAAPSPRNRAIIRLLYSGGLREA